MEINTIEDLQQMCIYIIMNAIFYHAWHHFNGFDDITPVLRYDRSIN